ncbi:helix-turn-helix transcriptional regulator [Hymenobacter cavernae]|uniref:helix-turn-helix transcriptional regulator n=1 Tax=Hymenobacter cavernae TaxID=2044852 RepID=UPI001668F446|nr:response regulator transcription factor [Hymenobacter cavernae]
MATPSGAVLLAAPPTLHRLGLAVTLRETWPDLALSTIPDPDQLSAVLQQRRFALVIADGTAPNSKLPAQLMQLRVCYPRQQLLVLSGRRQPTVARQQLAQSGYPLLPRRATPTEVVATVGELLSRAEIPAFSAAQAARRSGPATPLSPRELEVLRLVVDDCCNQEIADRLFVSVRTVESHRRALLQKTGAKTLVGLVVQAMRAGWVNVA